MTKCLMLDVDGVLVTGRPSDGQHWYAELETDLGIDPLWLKTAFFSVDWVDIVEGRANLLSCLQVRLDQLEAKFCAKKVVSYWFNMDSRIDYAVLANCAILRSQGVAIYLATNQEHCRARFLMNEMGLAAHVDGIVYSAQLGFSKPDASFYDAAAQIVGHEPSDIMLIDDTLKNVAGAQDAGWSASHWTGAATLSQIFSG